MLELQDLIHQIKNLVLLLAELQNIIDFGNIFLMMQIRKELRRTFHIEIRQADSK